MRFRPCIDIHNGKVKQIVGGSLSDKDDKAEENFVSYQDGEWYAGFFRKDDVRGGHIILLNPSSSPYYEASRQQAFMALRAWREGFAVGGGILDTNAEEYLEAGASHVIVTSFVFKDGRLNYENLRKMVRAAGKERLILDLSCRSREGQYYIVTDRWQKFTDVILTHDILDELSSSCDEFLVHAVDVEGKSQGIEEGLAQLLGSWDGCPVTYAGGVGSFADLKSLRSCGRNRLDVTVGSALDLYGGQMSYKEVLKLCDK